MRTPNNYKKYLKEGIVTTSMLEEVLYSFNKRAKNYRNQVRKYVEKKRECRYWYDKYGTIDKYEEKMEEMYQKKSIILNFFPQYRKQIHKVIRHEKLKIYDYEDEYEDYLRSIQLYEEGKHSDVVYKSSYFDREFDDYVEFIKVIVDVPEYYVFYEFTNYSFHQPIDESELPNYKGLEIKQIDDLTTYGKNINVLLSLQFCNQVFELIKDDNTTILSMDDMNIIPELSKTSVVATCLEKQHAAQ